MGAFGFSSLRPGQEEIVYTLLQGRDTLGILPTGTGKSACFMLPSVAHDYRTIIFSPLVALMRDQVQSLHNKGIPAVQISGMQTESQNRDSLVQWEKGTTKVMYVAPERLDNEMFAAVMSAKPPEFVVIDEAHCASQWSDNFRSSYRKIGGFITRHEPKIVAAFTATCPEEVEADIRRVFGMEKAKKISFMPRRKNLVLESAGYQSDLQLSRLIQTVQTGSIIVYCPTIKLVASTCKSLQDMLGSDRVTFFHGELAPNVKSANQDDWMQGASQVIVATNAFGMGIDKPDVRMVIHRDIPGSPEALAQEVGRAGRDGAQSRCVTLWSHDGIRTQEFFLECGHPDRKTITAVYEVLRNCVDPRTGIVQMSGNDVADALRLHDPTVKLKRQLDAARHILRGSRVLEVAEDHVPKFRITQKAMTEDKRYREYISHIARVGADLGAHTYEFTLEDLAGAASVSAATARAYLNNWAKEGWIALGQPSRAAPYRVVGDLSLVEFDRLRVKAEQAWQKLRDVQSYVAVPDERKHDFLERYFGVAKSEAVGK